MGQVKEGMASTIGAGLGARNRCEHTPSETFSTCAAPGMIRLSTEVFCCQSWSIEDEEELFTQLEVATWSDRMQPRGRRFP